MVCRCHVRPQNRGAGQISRDEYAADWHGLQVVDTEIFVMPYRIFDRHDESNAILRAPVSIYGAFLGAAPRRACRLSLQFEADGSLVLHHYTMALLAQA